MDGFVLGFDRQFRVCLIVILGNVYNLFNT